MRVNSTAHRIVLNALRDLPGLEISPAAASSTEDGLDLQVSWTGAETRYVLPVLWAREGWPSDEERKNGTLVLKQLYKRHGAWSR